MDGQQRLTSLYAVLKGCEVVRSNYTKSAIHIAFNPIEESFAVADAALRKDPTYIPDISTIWRDGDLFHVVEQFLKRLSASREVMTYEDKQIKSSISKLSALTSFPLTALELASNIDEEQVTEIFVRINSRATPLNQADFILTLMSVFWDEGRTELENFCRAARLPVTGAPSPYNHFLEPKPDQLLRASVGLGFKRARLQHVYSILRGKDLESGEFSEGRRQKQFDTLKSAQARVLNLQYWHDFLATIRLSGYTGGRMISSKNNLMFAYVLYLIGRTEFGIKEYNLRPAIARWFFMSSLTARFTGSPESAMEFDLARLRGISSGEEFLSALGRVSESILTGDYWSSTLPNELATSSPRSPSLFAYYASLVLVEAKALFSPQKVAALLDPSVHGVKAAAERHHLFPKGYLKNELGIVDVRETNQIANYAIVEWQDNADISDSPPSSYAPGMAQRFSGSDLRSMHHWHALPDGWDNMSYGDFLERRRELITGVIGEAYARLNKVVNSDDVIDESIPLSTVIDGGEKTDAEFKSTLRRNLHTGNNDSRIEFSALKTIAGFLNAHGGTLIIGVADDGTAIGVSADRFSSEDKMHLHLVTLVNARLGTKHMMYIHPRFESSNSERVLRVDCWKARSPVFLKDGGDDRFFVRTGAATTELTMARAQEFIKERFGS